MLRAISRQALAVLLLCTLTPAPFNATRAQPNATPAGETPASARRARALRLIEEVLEARRTELNIPGVSLAVFKDHQEIYMIGGDLTAPGRPVFTLAGAGRYQLTRAGTQLPGFVASFRLVKTGEAELGPFPEQPPGNVTLTRVGPADPKAAGGLSNSAPPGFKAPPTVEEVTDKVVTSMGGGQALRGLASLRQTVNVNFESEGLTGAGTVSQLRSVTTQPSTGTVVIEVKDARAKVTLSDTPFRPPAVGEAATGK